MSPIGQKGGVTIIAIKKNSQKIFPILKAIFIPSGL